MKHGLHNSIDELLAPETLSVLEGRVVKYVHCRPVSTCLSRSGSSLLKVETNDGRALSHYVLKRVSLGCDWIMRVTEDHHCRSVVLWQSGLLDGLKPAVENSIVACSRDGVGWAILMRDVTAALLPTQQPLSTTDNERILAGLAAMHAAHWNAPELTNPALGLCSLRSAFHSLSPKTVRQELDSKNRAVRGLVEGWELLFAQAEPQVAEILRQLVADPQPLCAALARYPQTLMHGDLQMSNVGLDRTQQSGAVILDWQLAAVAPPTLDLYWYVGIDEIPSAMKETSIEHYHRQLATHLGPRFDERDWQPMLELGSLAHLLRIGGWLAYNAMHAKSEDSRTSARSNLACLLESVHAAENWF
jgi:hypothetical protein